MYRAYLARAARWGQNNRSVSRPEDYLLGGDTAVETYPGRHREVHCCATTLRSPYNRFSRFLLGKKLGYAKLGLGVLRMLSASNVWCRLLTSHCFPLHSLLLGIAMVWSPLMPLCRVIK